MTFSNPITKINEVDVGVILLESGFKLLLENANGIQINDLNTSRLLVKA
jgi:hypothetical protein